MKKRQAYKVLSDLIFKGYLTMGLDIGDSHAVFKTINDKEYDMIKLLAGYRKSPLFEKRLNVFYIIYSMYLLNKQNVLIDRDKRIPELYDYLMGIPKNLIDLLVVELNKLRDAVYDASAFFEGFTYTKKSRDFWEVISDLEYSKIIGVDNKFNTFQESWVHLNKALDKEALYNQNFSLSLLVASASNPKGVQKIQAQHTSNSESLEDKRKSLAKTGVLNKEKAWTSEGWAAPVDTVEGIVAELDRQMQGKKDKHDLFIEDHMRQIRERVAKKTKEAEERIQKIREENKDLPAISGSQRVLSPQEVEALFSKKTPATTRVVSDESVSKEERDHYFKKIGTQVLTSRK